MITDSKLVELIQKVKDSTTSAYGPRPVQRADVGQYNKMISQVFDSGLEQKLIKRCISYKGDLLGTFLVQFPQNTVPELAKGLEKILVSLDDKRNCE